MLEREVDTNRQLYNSLLRRLKETGVAASFQASNVAIVQRAVPPGVPSSPRKGRNAMLGMVIGLALGIGLALVLDFFDDTLATPEEATAFLRVPALGTLPLVERENGSAAAPDTPARSPKPSRGRPIPVKASRNGGAPGPEPSVPDTIDQAALATGQNALAEALRVFRTSLLLSSAEGPPRIVLFTSAVAGEGKTMTAFNTAVTLAQAGMRGLIVDGDLRRPRLHKILGASNDRGLTSYLAGQASFEDVVLPTSHENLFFVPAGPQAPNPSELLGSVKMNDTLQRLASRCDFVIVDSPPVLPVADALVLSQFVEGVVLVVDSMRTSKKLVRTSRDKLLTAKARILGFVLNQMPPRPGYSKAYRRYRYSRYYGYHYGSDHYGDYAEPADRDPGEESAAS